MGHNMQDTNERMTYNIEEAGRLLGIGRNQAYEAAKRGDFLVYDAGFRARTYTYGETAKAARGFAAQLQTAGIAKGDKIGRASCRERV